MKTTIGLAQARELLQTREDLLNTGRSQRQIRSLVSAGRLIRVRRDRYIEPTAHDDLWNEGRHLIAVMAAHLNADPPGPVFWGPSAAAVLGLPLYRLDPKKVHTVILGARHGRTRAGIAQHGVGIDDADIVEVDGIRCTSLERTVLDLACTTSPEAGLSAADAALRRVAVEGHRQDPDRATDWHRRMSLRAAAVRSRGVRQARWILDFADGRAQLPGESVSRLQLHRIGFTGLVLQPHVIGAEGDDYWIDFGFPRNRVFGEFDGQGKYLDPEIRGDRTTEDAVLAEKDARTTSAASRAGASPAGRTATSAPRRRSRPGCRASASAHRPDPNSTPPLSVHAPSEGRRCEGAWRLRGGVAAHRGRAGAHVTNQASTTTHRHPRIRNLPRSPARTRENGSMDWQTTSEDTVPSARVSEADARLLRARPPSTGAWRDGDPAGDRRFEAFGPFRTEGGAELPLIRLAYESWGELNEARDNAILILHALTGDSHVIGEAGHGHPTSGWWGEIVGPGCAIDTDEWFVIAPNMLGGCQGSTGPASIAPDGYEWASRFPYLTIRDQVAAQVLLADALGIERWGAVIGGSMGGMHALEWAVGHPERVERLAILSSPPITTADQLALNFVQLETVRMDPRFAGGEYYDAPVGEGPHRGLALARRMALLNYRSPIELNQRFQRSWQSDVSPLGQGGRYAVESYLDFHGNKFTRRFDANSYLTLVEAMNSHDIGRDRGGVEDALKRVTATTLVLGIDTDRLFPVDGQHRIAGSIPHTLDGNKAVVLASDFGHDGFLIETDAVGMHLGRLLAS